MNEIIFSYNNTRCHAEVTEHLSGDERYIGEIDGWGIYQTRSVIFNQFGFVAVKKDATSEK